MKSICLVRQVSTQTPAHLTDLIGTLLITGSKNRYTLTMCDTTPP